MLHSFHIPVKYFSGLIHNPAFAKKYVETLDRVGWNKYINKNAFVIGIETYPKTIAEMNYYKTLKIFSKLIL